MTKSSIPSSSLTNSWHVVIKVEKLPRDGLHIRFEFYYIFFINNCWVLFGGTWEFDDLKIQGTSENWTFRLRKGTNLCLDFGHLGCSIVRFEIFIAKLYKKLYLKWTSLVNQTNRTPVRSKNRTSKQNGSLIGRCSKSERFISRKIYQPNDLTAEQFLKRPKSECSDFGHLL